MPDGTADISLYFFFPPRRVGVVCGHVHGVQRRHSSVSSQVMGMCWPAISHLFRNLIGWIFLFFSSGRSARCVRVHAATGQHANEWDTRFAGNDCGGRLGVVHGNCRCTV